jgi:hypothetical protein
MDTGYLNSSAAGSAGVVTGANESAGIALLHRVEPSFHASQPPLGFAEARMLTKVDNMYRPIDRITVLLYGFTIRGLQGQGRLKDMLRRQSGHNLWRRQRREDGCCLFLVLWV